ncbi:MAG: hypothetical protein GX905_01815 [Bacteroidales bacterium]|nr:hypothetical protein [Bacteroidales bacterium]
MNNKALITLLLFVLLGVKPLFAQEEISKECISNSSISHEAVKSENYKDAYKPWKVVIKDCPLLRFYTFTDGYKILKGLMDEIGDKNSPEYKKYFEELMATHDLRIKLTPDFLAKGVNVSSVDEAIGTKALDYLTYSPNIDVKQAYDWLKQSTLGASSDELSPNVLYFFLDMSNNILKNDESHREIFLQDYFTAVSIADKAIEASDREVLVTAFKTVKENLTALFINSGTADCETLQSIYAPQVEENKENIDFLNKVIDIMRTVKCTDQDAYLQASYYVHQIKPSAESAAGCAYMAYKKGDYHQAMIFFDEAIELETDLIKKAEKAYAAAAVLFTNRQLANSRSYAQKAIGFNKNYGAPYILIANLYATNPNWSDDPVLNKCVYFLIIDKLQQAKAVDPSVAEEADKLIRTYSKYTPDTSELFMMGYKKGDRVTVGGWIGESTTIR